uniref:Uncharacterized protein n=1 Tax=Ciona intestinalis TaxID=7719 RepID=H2XYF6_CIOIN
MKKQQGGPRQELQNPQLLPSLSYFLIL